jgi:hypothetical protein
MISSVEVRYCGLAADSKYERNFTRCGAQRLCRDPSPSVPNARLP